MYSEADVKAAAKVLTGWRNKLQQYLRILMHPGMTQPTNSFQLFITILSLPAELVQQVAILNWMPC